ncbi:dephospho-CoA kinase [Flavobacterium sp.]|uniref:dephospho-CoA kinase n=1 Tax=Flavobacterium sp. TaxID=239 RepID=UPI00352904C1
MTKIIGLTGGIGSGKSTVAKYIASKGIPVYIADSEAKKITNSKRVTNEIVQKFGFDILDGNQKINRKKLATIVFNDSAKLNVLNKIIHPKVKQHFKNWLAKHQNEKIVIKEVAILFETNGHLDCDKVILVTAPLTTRIERTIKRDKTTREEVENRIKNQMADEDKIPLSDFVIENLDLQSTYKQIDEVLNNLNNS